MNRIRSLPPPHIPNISQIAILFLISYFVSLWFPPLSLAATGVNQFLTFQGKMVNADGTNVTDGLYDFVFNIYDSAASTGTSQFTESWTNAALYTSTMTSAPAQNGESLVYSSNTNEASLLVGQILWNTTLGEAVTITSVNAGTNVLGISPTRQAWNTSDTITNRIYVKDGIFRVALNSLSQSSSFASIFSDDTRFLGVNFNNDGEMRPRVRLTAAPYAMNAASLGSVDAGGYLRSNTSDSYTSGTLTMDSGTTLDINGDISIADTNIALDGTTTTLTSTGAFTLTPGGAVTLGDGGDTLAINTSDWDISTAGTLTNTEWQGTAVATQYGGTGQNWSAVAQGSLPYFSTTGTMTTLAGAGTNGWVLKYNTGTSVPYWAADNDTTYTAGNDIDFNGTQIDIESQLDYVSAINRASGDLTLTTVAGNLVNISTGNLKVGNGTPGVTLNGEDVYVEGTLEVDGAVQFDGSLDTNSDLAIADTDIALDGASTNFTATGNFSLNTDDLVALKASGNVGIGTTNPGTKFQVNGDISLFSDSSTTRKISLELNNQANSHDLMIVAGSYGTSGTAGGNMYLDGGAGMGAGAPGNVLLSTQYFGNVGIGTTNPGYKLQVAGDIDVTTGNTYRLAGADVGQYFIDAAGTNGQVWTSDGTGRGGWTTISAGTTYTASNGLTLSTADFQLGGNLTRDTTITQDSAENLTFTNSGTGNTVFNLSSTGDFMVQDNGTAALFVKDDGNVGIGTTNPAAKLYINTSGINQTNTYINQANTANLITGATSTDYGLYTRINNTGSITDDVYAVGTGRFSYGNYIDITDSGALNNNDGDAFKRLYGIYSSVQDTGTHTSGTSDIVAGYLSAQGAATNVIGTTYGLMVSATGADTNYAIYSNNGTNYFSGSVGIGTTNPGYKLQVAGDIDVTTGNTYRLAGADVGQFFIDAAGTNGQVWTSDGSGRGSWQPGGATYTAGNDIDFAGTQIDLEPQLDFVTTISRASSNLTLQTTTSGNIYLTSAGSVNLTGDLILTGKASSASTTEGTLYYDTDDDQLKVYANGKWQADRSATTLIVAASDSKNKEKADYVADGTDDQTEINAAITALPSTGGAVVLLDGTYNIGNGSAGRITIAKSNVSLVGSGASTVIKRMFNESGDNGLIAIGDGSGTYTKMTVSNLSVDGNNGTYTNSYNHGIYPRNTTTYVNLTNNWINNAGGYGVYFSSSDANRYNVTGNYLAANTEGGIYAVTYYLNIANNQFVQNGSWGTSGYDIYSPDTGSSITNNVFYLPQYRGIRLSSNGVTVGNNTFRGCANYCIFLESATSNTVTANTFYQDGSHTAIAVDGSHRNTIANNNINELGNTRNGILLTGSSTNNTLTGNQIYSTNTSAGAAIQIDSGSTGNYLADNRFSGSGTATQGTNVLTDSATGTIYGGQTTNGNSNFAFTPTGNVGIGTTNPAFKLHVAANDNNGSQITISSLTNQNDRLYLGYDSDGGFGRIQAITEGTAYRNLAINSGGGNVGIGTTNPRAKLEVNGTVSYTIPTSFSGAGSNADWTTGFSSQAISTSILATGAVVGNGIYSNSDMRLKENISPIDTDLVATFFDNIDPVGFTWITDNTLDTGFIAQDLMKYGLGYLVSAVADENMQEITDESGFTSPAGARYTVRYDAIIPILTAGIKNNISAINNLSEQVNLDTQGNLQTDQQLSNLDHQFSLLSVDVATHTNFIQDLTSSFQLLTSQVSSLFSRQTQLEDRSQQLEARIEQVATLSAAPLPTSSFQLLASDVSTLSARVSYLEHQVATGLAPEPVSIASVAGAVDDYLSTQLPNYLSDYQAKVDLALELTASQSALISTLLDSPVSSESSIVNDLTTSLPNYLSLSSLTAGDVDANLLTVGVINSATNLLTFLGDLMTLDATGSLVTINGDLFVSGKVIAASIESPEIAILASASATISAEINSLGTRDQALSTEIIGLQQLVASLSAQVASLSAEIASPSAAATPSAGLPISQ